MKRAPWYLVTGTVAGFAAVIGLHSQAGTPAALGQGQSPGGTGQTPGATPTSGPSPGGGSGGSGGGGGTGQARSATGVLEHYGYGELAVRVTVHGSRITDVSVAQLSTADPTSQQIAQQDIPVLRSEVLRADSAKIDAVGGATFTSEAYAGSLQSALDKLHIA